jgi:hypothetical protein
MSTHPHQMSPTKTCFREAGGKSALLKGGRITHNASYGACMAAQRYRDALIRGDLGMARIWPLTLAPPCLAKSVGPDSYSESQPQLCCAACRVTCHHPTGSDFHLKLHAATNRYLAVPQSVRRVSCRHFAVHTQHGLRLQFLLLCCEKSL